MGSTQPNPESSQLGARLLDDIYCAITRFVAFPQEASRIAVTLWAAHTYALDYASATPYLNVYSPAPRCGKSTLFEVLALLVRVPVGGSNMSPAVIYRVIDQEHPTLLLDEVDAQMRADRERASAIQSILNAGYRRGPTSMVWRSQGQSFTPAPFETFCPKAFAGVGANNLHATTLDRCIPVLLERKVAGDKVERFRAKRFEPEAEILKQRIIDWIAENDDLLAASEPDLPEELDDRTQEIWEPLLALADVAGGRWPSAARAAALELHTETDLEDLPLGIQLLSDIRKVFDGRETWTIGSEELAQALKDMSESPWSTWATHGVKTGLSPRALARMLRPFGIRPRTVRLGGEKDKPTRKGYRRDWFEEAWERYVPDADDDVPVDE